MSTGLLALIASLPIVAIFVFMVGFRWTATKAMPVAFVIALVLALLVWKTPFNWVAAATVNGVVIAFKILFIVFGALLVLFTMRESGAIEAINRGGRYVHDVETRETTDSYLRTSRFVGRDEELAQARAFVNECVAGAPRPRTLAIAGPRDVLRVAPHLERRLRLVAGLLGGDHVERHGDRLRERRHRLKASLILGRGLDVGIEEQGADLPPMLAPGGRRHARAGTAARVEEELSPNAGRHQKSLPSSSGGSTPQCR